MGKQWNFIFLGSKITADGDCGHEIKRRLLLGRKVMTNLDSILKSRDITLPTKVCLVKAMVFPVVMYGCENWTIKKAERRRIDAFELWCWSRLLRVPWTARRSNQSILKEISLEYSLEGLMLKLKLQHFGHLMRRTDSFEKTLMLGKIESRRRRGWQRMRWTWVWVGSRSWWWIGKPGCCSPRDRKELDMTEQLNWTEVLSHMPILPGILCRNSSRTTQDGWEVEGEQMEGSKTTGSQELSPPIHPFHTRVLLDHACLYARKLSLGRGHSSWGTLQGCAYNAGMCFTNMFATANTFGLEIS